MDSSNSRRTGGKSSVVAGSVWETRMKSDEFKGGIKVFNEEENGNGEGNNAGGNKRLSLKKGQTFGGVGVSGKRKTWKSESFEGLEKNPIRVAKGKSMEHCKDLSLSVDGIKKVPIQVKKGIRDLSKSVDGIERTPIHSKKLRSDVAKKGVEMSSKDGIESGEGIEGNSVKASAQSCNENGNDDKVLVFDDEKIEGSDKDSNENLKYESEWEEHCKEFGVCQEMVISSNGDDEEDEEMEDVGDEKKSFDIKEMNVPEVEKKPNKVPNEMKPNKAVNEVKKLQEDNKPSTVTNGVKNTSQFPNKAAPFSPTLNKQPPPVVKNATLYDDYHYQSFPQTQNQLHNLVDLVMWRDVSKSALIFGVGTFIIISSSYTQDLDISCITVTSYAGLVYLAAIFLYRSIICRGVVDVDESRCVVGEEAAIWVLKLVLPYLNEFLLKLRALFSGDPYTTMKLLGGFNLAILMVMMLLSTNRHCAADAVKKNKSMSSRWCDDSSNKECLQLSDDIETMELLMDSEASKMVFEASAAIDFASSKNPTTRALDPSPAACDRNTGKSCEPDSNPGTKVPPNCSLYTRAGCH